jgi:hypothetical protein
MRMMKDLKIMGRESTYTHNERQHRINRCTKLPQKYQKKCTEESKQILQQGRVNYMTHKGEMALLDACEA